MMFLLFWVGKSTQNRQEMDSFLHFLQERIKTILRIITFWGELDPRVEENLPHYQCAQVNSENFFIQKLEVISLRTSGKRLPGKKLAIYVGVVITVLVLSYNLTKDLSFILVSDKEWVLNFIDSISCSKRFWVTICDQGIKQFSFKL